MAIPVLSPNDGHPFLHPSQQNALLNGAVTELPPSLKEALISVLSSVELSQSSISAILVASHQPTATVESVLAVVETLLPVDLLNRAVILGIVAGLIDLSQGGDTTTMASTVETVVLGNGGTALQVTAAVDAVVTESSVPPVMPPTIAEQLVPVLTSLGLTSTAVTEIINTVSTPSVTPTQIANVVLTNTNSAGVDLSTAMSLTGLVATVVGTNQTLSLGGLSTLILSTMTAAGATPLQRAAGVVGGINHAISMGAGAEAQAAGASVATTAAAITTAAATGGLSGPDASVIGDTVAPMNSHNLQITKLGAAQEIMLSGAVAGSSTITLPTQPVPTTTTVQGATAYATTAAANAAIESEILALLDAHKASLTASGVVIPAAKRTGNTVEWYEYVADTFDATVPVSGVATGYNQAYQVNANVSGTARVKGTLTPTGGSGYKGKFKGTIDQNGVYGEVVGEVTCSVDSAGALSAIGVAYGKVTFINGVNLNNYVSKETNYVPV